MPQAALTSPPEPRTEHLSGLVERVTFHNAENDFCVLRVQVRGQRDLVTVVGHAALVSAGEPIQGSGTWGNERTHALPHWARAGKRSRGTERRSTDGRTAWCSGQPSPRPRLRARWGGSRSSSPP